MKIDYFQAKKALRHTKVVKGNSITEWMNPITIQGDVVASVGYIVVVMPD